MNRLTILCLMLLAGSAAFSQETAVKTNIEAAIHTRGFLYKQEVFSTESPEAFRIDPVKITNLESFAVTAGLKIIHKVQAGKELKTLYNYIDQDEISGILTTLQYIKTILKSKTVPGTYTEIKFTTKSGFQVKLQTVLNANSKLDWNFSVQTDTGNDKTFVPLQQEDVEKLQKMFEQAKGRL